MSDVDVVVIECGSQRVEVRLYGAHVTSWRDNGVERLFLSRKAVLDGTKAIRGGIPLIFPQFAGRGPLSKHGFARTRMWTHQGSRATDNQAEATFTLESDAETLKEWPHAFSATYTITVAASGCLRCAWSIKNTGAETVSFHAALHTYFAVPDVANTTVSSLLGTRFIDQLQEGKELKEESDAVEFHGEVDRIYLDTPDTLTIHTSGEEALRLTKSASLPDAVVWNPHVAKAAAIGDMADDEWKTMVCVEAGAIEPGCVDLGAGDTIEAWTEMRKEK